MFIIYHRITYFKITPMHGCQVHVRSHRHFLHFLQFMEWEVGLSAPFNKLNLAYILENSVVIYSDFEIHLALFIDASFFCFIFYQRVKFILDSIFSLYRYIVDIFNICLQTVALYIRSWLRGWLVDAVPLKVSHTAVKASAPRNFLPVGFSP